MKRTRLAGIAALCACIGLSACSNGSESTSLAGAPSSGNTKPTIGGPYQTLPPSNGTKNTHSTLSSSAPAVPSTRQSGIYQNQQPFSLSTFRATNYWTGPDPSNGALWSVVYAGTTPQGLAGVRVYSVSANPQTSGMSIVGQYTNSATAPFTIVSYKGSTLDLTDGSGRSWTFDVATSSFSES